MKNKIVVLSILLTAAFLADFVLAQADNELAQKSRPATASDVAGEWEMVYQAVRPSIKDGSMFFADYQVFHFYENGYVKNITSTKPLSKEDIKMYLDTMPQKTTYSFVKDGLLVIDRSTNDFDNIAISVIVEDTIQPLRKEAPLLKKGDLILSYLDPQRKVYMQRYLRGKK